MSIEEFITACKGRGWHFTASWVERRLRQMLTPESDDRYMERHN